MTALLYFLIWLFGVYCGGVVATRAAYIKLYELKKRLKDLENKIKTGGQNGS